MPPDNNPKPNMSTLMAILDKAKYAIPGFGIPLAVRDIASRVSLNRMSENLNPYNYSTNKSAAMRFVDAAIRNKKEEERADTEQYIEKGYGMQPDPQFKPRVDLLQMLAGKPQKYSTIQQSKYRPKFESDKSTQYYSSKDLEDQIVESLGLNDMNINWQKDILQIAKDVALVNDDGTPVKGKKGGYVSIVPGLGGATYGVGRDKKGIYLSYSDVWDLDPSKGVFADEKKSYNPTTLEGLKNIGYDAGKAALTNVVNARATPPNVYGRIYFDPKTGKPIRK